MTEVKPNKASSHNVVYLDNAATTFPKPGHVYQAADAFYRHYGGNAGRGSNPLAHMCKQLIERTRGLVASCLGAPTSQQVIFAPSATHALNLAILGTELRPSAVVYVTPFEHNSVLRPVEYLRKSKGVYVRQIAFERKTYSCDLGRLSAAFRIEPPSMVCVTQASNVCGLMPPVIEIARIAKEANPQATVIVDGAQAAGLHPLHLDAGIVDAFVFSGHKSLYGPYGIAGLILATDWRPDLVFFGGTGTSSESVDMPSELPSLYEVGSHNVWAIAGLCAALEWLQKKDRNTIIKHTSDLARQLIDELASFSNVTVFMPPEDAQWCGIVSFTVEGSTPQAIEAALGSREIAVRAGLHCAPWAHQWLGTFENGGTVRASPGLFNSFEDVLSLTDFIRQIQ